MVLIYYKIIGMLKNNNYEIFENLEYLNSSNDHLSLNSFNSFSNERDNDYYDSFFDEEEEIEQNPDLLLTPSAITESHKEEEKKSNTENPKNVNIIQINNSQTTIEKPILFNIIVSKIKISDSQNVNKNFSSDKVHTKYKDDNIRTKIKRTVCKHTLVYLNNLLKLSKNPNLNSKKFFKVSSSVFDVYKKEENLELLNMKLKDIFSQKVSGIYSIKYINHNINIINSVLQYNDETINAALNFTFEDILKIYIGEVKNVLFENFRKIEDDILILKKKGFDDNYIEKYKNIAKNFKESIICIDPRRKKSIK